MGIQKEEVCAEKGTGIEFRQAGTGQKALQWHPAFYAGIQIELEDEAENLIFENEHQLGTKPFGIDVLIVKKESERPIQVIVTKELAKEENLWMRSLTDQLENIEDAEELIQNYKNKEKNILYSSVMNIIVQANKKKFEEVMTMCEALEELMKERLDVMMQEKLREGEQRGKERVNELMKMLAKDGRVEDIIHATEDAEYQEKLFREFGILEAE